MEDIDTAASVLRTATVQAGGYLPVPLIDSVLVGVIDLDEVAEVLGIVPRAALMRAIDAAGLHRRNIGGNEVLTVRAAPDRERLVQ